MFPITEYSRDSCILHIVLVRRSGVRPLSVDEIIDDSAFRGRVHSDPLPGGCGAISARAAAAQTGPVADALTYQHAPGRLRVHTVCLLTGRDTGAGTWELRYGYARTAAGRWLVAATEQGICAIDPAPDRNSVSGLIDLWQPARSIPDDAFALEVVRETIAGIATDRTLHLRGTAFQLAVWQLLLRIPAGFYTHYATLARWVAKPGAARAVGSAVGANRIAVLVPCHRVLPASGAPGAYRWGGALKQRLLAREAALFRR